MSDQNQPVGTIATQPCEVDDTVIRAANAIYDGNVTSLTALISRFLSTYKE